MARYSFDYTPAQQGQIADASLRDIISLPAHVLNNDLNRVDGPIRPGYLVQVLVTTNTNEAYVKVVNNLSDHIIGIAVFSHCRENQKSNISETGKRDANYLNRDIVSVLSKGRIWVFVSRDVKEGEIAYIAQPDSGHSVHYFTNVSTNNKEIGVFMSNTASDKYNNRIAILEFDLSAHAVGIQGL